MVSSLQTNFLRSRDEVASVTDRKSLGSAQHFKRLRVSNFVFKLSTLLSLSVLPWRSYALLGDRDFHQGFLGSFIMLLRPTNLLHITFQLNPKLELTFPSYLCSRRTSAVANKQSSCSKLLNCEWCDGGKFLKSERRDGGGCGAIVVGRFS